MEWRGPFRLCIDYKFSSFFSLNRLRNSQVVQLMFSEQTIDVYCHVGDFGCGDGGWTLAMKINGRKVQLSLTASCHM